MASLDQSAVVYRRRPEAQYISSGLTACEIIDATNMNVVHETMQIVSNLWLERRCWESDSLPAVFRRTSPTSCASPARGRSAQARSSSALAVDRRAGVWAPHALRPISPSVRSAAWNAADRRAATRTAGRGRPQRDGPAVPSTSDRRWRRGRHEDVRTEFRPPANSSAT